MLISGSRFFTPFWCGGFRYIYEEFQWRKNNVWGVIKWLQDLVIWKLQGNDGFRKAKRSKGSFVTDRVRPLILFGFLFCVFASHLIGSYVYRLINFPLFPGVWRNKKPTAQGDAHSGKRTEWAFSQCHCEHSWVERREWASNNLAP